MIQFALMVLAGVAVFEGFFGLPIYFIARHRGTSPRRIALLLAPIAPMVAAMGWVMVNVATPKSIAAGRASWTFDVLLVLGAITLVVAFATPILAKGSRLLALAVALPQVPLTPIVLLLGGYIISGAAP